MIDDVDQHAGYEGGYDGGYDTPEDETEAERDFQERVARRRPGGDVEMLLRELHEMVDQARPSPLSTAVKIDRDVVLDILDQAIERLPDDLRGARWLLKEREEFLDRTRMEADEILEAARAQAERMVQRSEVLRAAEQKARRIVEQARADAARLASECDDYCDQRLVQLEAVLERTMAVVAAGREKLRPRTDIGGHPFADGDEEGDDRDDGYEEDEEPDTGFFDQDRE
ncbi:MAG TPA: ATP synthase F0 subunit B [Acidimicrobiales bacterium]